MNEKQTVVNIRENVTGEGANGLYMPPSWHGLKQQIVYLAQFGGSIQVIQGVSGSGKTTLAGVLQAEKICEDYIALEVSSEEDIQGFLFNLLWQLGLGPEKSGGLGAHVSLLRSYAQSVHQEGARVVVAIDDAQNIPESTLAALVSVFQGGAEPGIGLHFILLAEPGVPAKLDGLGLLDIEVHDSSIPSLSPSEIEQFLFAKGLALQDDVDPSETKKLWRDSEGIPGRVLESYSVSGEYKPQHQASSGSEQETRSAEENELSFSGLPFGHIAAVALLSVVLIWAFLARNSAPENETEKQPLLNSISSSSVASLKVTSIKESIILAEGLGKSELNADVGDSGESKESPDEVPLAGEVLPHQSSSDQNKQADSDKESQKAEPLVVKDESLVSGFIEESRRGVVSASSQVDVEAVASEKRNMNSSSENASSLPVKLDQESNSSDVQSSTANKNEQNKDAITPKMERLDYRRAEAALRTMPEDAYVLQIMAVSSYEKLRAYAEAQSNSASLMIYRAKRQGRVLYILVEGFYANKDSAKAAKVNLPTPRDRQGAWPKRIGAIKADIAEFR